MFDRIRGAGLTLKPSKCVFGQRVAKILGFEASQRGIVPNPDKLKAISDFPVPRKQKDVQKFLGMCNFYRRFIENFTSTAKPLYSILGDKKQLK